MNAEDLMIRECLAPARHFEPEESDVDDILARLDAAHGRSSRGRLAPGNPVAWLAAFVVLAGGLLAVPPVRATLNDVASNFAGYFGRDESDAPGQPIRVSELPSHSGIGSPDNDRRRVLAAAGGFQLFMASESDGAVIKFVFGGAAWEGGLASWEQHLANAPIFILGAPETKQAEAAGERPLFGIAAGNVARVRAVYANGDHLSADASSGGFILLLNPKRRLSRVVALDAAAREMGSVPASVYTSDLGGRSVHARGRR